MNIYLVLFVVFSAVSFIGFLWLAIVAFKRGIGWGLAVLLLSPIAAIVFSLVNWYEARKAFLLYISTFLLSFGSLIFIYSQVGLGNMQRISEKLQHGELTPQQAYQLMGRAAQGDHRDQSAATTTRPTSQMADSATTNTGTLTAITGQSETRKGGQASSVATSATTTAKKPSPKKSTESKLASATNANIKPVENQVGDSSSRIPNIDKIPKDPLAQNNQPPSNKVTLSLGRVSRYIGRSFLITLKNGTKHRGILRKVTRTRLEMDLQLYGGNFIYRIDKDQIRRIQMYKLITLD